MEKPDILHPATLVGIVGRYANLQEIIQAVGPEMAQKSGSVAAVAGLAIEMLSHEATASVADQHLRETGKSVTIVVLPE